MVRIFFNSDTSCSAIGVSHRNRVWPDLLTVLGLYKKPHHVTSNIRKFDTKSTAALKKNTILLNDTKLSISNFGDPIPLKKCPS
jgi:hypothetical protein